MQMCAFNFQCRPDTHTGSNLNTEVKLLTARLVLVWKTAWEFPVLLAWFSVVGADKQCQINGSVISVGVCLGESVSQQPQQPQHQ